MGEEQEKDMHKGSRGLRTILRHRLIEHVRGGISCVNLKYSCLQRTFNSRGKQIPTWCRKTRGGSPVEEI